MGLGQVGTEKTASIKEPGVTYRSVLVPVLGRDGYRGPLGPPGPPGQLSSALRSRPWFHWARNSPLLVVGHVGCSHSPAL